MPLRFFIQIGGLLASILFLAFGVYVLVLSYNASDPFTFLALFFSSSFMVLLSAAMGAVFVIRIIGHIRGPSVDPSEGE